MLTAAIFLIARRWEQPKCPTNEWINKPFCIFIQWILLSNKKEWSIDICCKMDIPWKHAKWKTSHKRPHIVWFCLYEISQRGIFPWWLARFPDDGQKADLWSSGEEGNKRCGGIANRYRVSSQVIENVLKLDCRDDHTRLRIY